jgi:hypothetical protein
MFLAAILVRKLKESYGKPSIMSSDKKKKSKRGRIDIL